MSRSQIQRFQGRIHPMEAYYMSISAGTSNNSVLLPNNRRRPFFWWQVVVADPRSLLDCTNAYPTRWPAITLERVAYEGYTDERIPFLCMAGGSVDHPVVPTTRPDPKHSMVRILLTGEAGG